MSANAKTGDAATSRDNGVMTTSADGDDSHLDELQAALEEADASKAPDIAQRLASELGERLDEDPDTSATMEEEEPH